MPIFLFTFIAKIPGFLKKHHEAALIVLATILLLWVLDRNETNWAGRLKQANDIHAQEIKQIDEVRKQELKQYQVNIQALQDKLKNSQALYDQQKVDLTTKKKNRISSIVDADGDDPVKLANDLSKVTGFKVRQ